MDAIDQDLEIPARGVDLDAEIAVPVPVRGTVLLVDAGRDSCRRAANRYVAAELQDVGLGTVVVDLLTPIEAQVDGGAGELQLGVELLAGRLTAVIDWVVDHEFAPGPDIGLFGAGTAAAAALVAAAARVPVATVVSCAGHLDLVGEVLGLVGRPALLIVGERDQAGIELNHRAMGTMRGQTHLELVPGVVQPLEEPRSMELVARMVGHWFVRHLGRVVTRM
jgi:hypothetical protein